MVSLVDPERASSFCSPVNKFQKLTKIHQSCQKKKYINTEILISTKNVTIGYSVATVLIPTVLSCLLQLAYNFKQ